MLAPGDMAAIAATPPASIQDAGLRTPGLAHDLVVERQFAVGPGPDAQVIAELPIIQIVADCAPRAAHRPILRSVRTSRRPAGRFAMASCMAALASSSGNAGRILGKDGIGFERQVVQGQMARF